MAEKRKSLMRLTHDEIEAYILDPENNTLPEAQMEQFNRVMSAARLLDSHPDIDHVITLLQAKYNCAAVTLRRDVELAREVYKTKHTFDWDFWHTWQIRDQLELIRECKIKGNLKEWNAAKKVLHQIIGDKPEDLADDRNKGNNQVFIQMNFNGQVVNMPISEAHALKPDEMHQVMVIMHQPIEDAEAEEIMDS